MQRQQHSTRIAVFAVAASLAATLVSANPITFNSKGAQQKLARAVSELGQGNLEKADALFQEILKEDPSHVQALLGRAQVAISDNQLAEADRSVNAVLKQQSQRPEAHNMKGVVLLLQNRPSEAQKAFTHAIELHPEYVTPRIYLAAISRSTGDYQLAVKQYKTLTDIAPRLPAGYLGQAEAYMMMNNEREAFRILEEWKAVPTSGLVPFHVIANVHLARKDHPKAIQELNAALKKVPGDSETVMYIGDAHVVAGDPKAAIRQFESALKADPKNLGAALRLGDQLIATGQRARAVESFRAALKIDPTHPMASNNVAWLLSEEGKNLDEALRLATTAVAADANFVDAHDTVGWIHFMKGDYNKAVEALKKAKQLSGGKRPDIAAHLGLAYAKAGQKSLALPELQFALASGNALPNRTEVQRVATELTRPAR